jgi:UDP-N-acetylmuramyl pentapeptide phosphotransferase/UDP-N-acetylglucosamine-1-phosphate transferase
MGVVYVMVSLCALLLCVVLIHALRPFLLRYALARPNARSSHAEPTPQGGGIAVIVAAMLAVGGALATGALPASAATLGLIGVAALGLGVTGAVDDIRPMGVAPRLALQALAVVITVNAGEADLRLLPQAVPLPVERTVEIIAGIWFVNLVNFMDGLDWMTVAETVPIAATVALFALAGKTAPQAGLVAAALLGGMLGFAPFNRPVARLFLGDVGSLPVGLVVAWLLFELAAAGALAAAILLPLYYCFDATLTLLRRLGRGEQVWQAHRSHFYQRAVDNGLTVKAVVAHVLALNLVLAVLATASLVWPSAEAQVGLVAAGFAAVALVLLRFARRQPTLAQP